MSGKRIVLWRWDKPSEEFTPTESPIYSSIRLGRYDEVVRAGLNPTDWKKYMTGKYTTGENVLHKIVLTREQAKKCVVAEADFRLTEEERDEFIKKTHTHLVGSTRKYGYANYKESFVCLLEYSGGYNLPEVLIPFPVKAEMVSLCW